MCFFSFFVSQISKEDESLRASNLLVIKIQNDQVSITNVGNVFVCSTKASSTLLDFLKLARWNCIYQADQHH